MARDHTARGVAVVTLVIDRTGIVREVLIGARSYEELTRTLERWLKPSA